MVTFKEAKALYEKDLIGDLSSTKDGARFLLLRSLSRSRHLEVLANKHGLDISNVAARDLLEQLFNSDAKVEAIEGVIREEFLKERAEREKNEPDLINELYKMKEFDWGGLHQNSLEKTIVNNYVKRVRSYELLNAHVENELLASMRGYVRCSWYNHWTSIIIEDIFKAHNSVLPAIGLVKKIDFFVAGTPFDLKVTYLPEGYVKDCRKLARLRPELTLLKQCARALNVEIDATLGEGELLAHLWTIVADRPEAHARKLAEELKAYRFALVDEIARDPARLMHWLYQNQGERRFDAANRLFLVLVNEANFFASWQLKRNKALLSAEIGRYLDNAKAPPGQIIEFEWEGAKFKTRADVIVVRHAPV